MTATLNSGTATFNSVTFNTAGAGYALTATDTANSVNAPNSNTFTVNAQSTVTSLAINAISSPQTAGTGFTVTAVAKDQFGNVANNSSDSVTLSIVSGSAQSTFSNNGSATMTATLSSGTATFSGVAFNTAGSYTLGAKDTTANVTAPDSNAFTVLATTANKLVFTAAPSGNQTVSSTASVGPFVLTVEDQYGNPVTNTGSAATITVNTTSGGTTGFTPFFTPTSGGSSASAISIANGALTTGNFYYSDTKSGGPTISATGTVNGHSVGSSPNVTETMVASSGTNLVFPIEPSNTFAGNTMNPAVTVQIQDQFGNNVSTSGVTINLSLSAGTVASGASASTNGSGLATFPSIVIDTAGAGLTMNANSGGGASGTSTSFNVTVLVSNGLNRLNDSPVSDAGSGVASLSYYYCIGYVGSCTSGTFIGSSTTSTNNYQVSWTNQPADGAYRVVTVGTDNVGNVSGPSAAVPVTVDNTGPSVAITFPSNSSSYNSTTWTGIISGTASDPISGITSTSVAIEDTTTGMWWNGTAARSISPVRTTSRRMGPPVGVTVSRPLH